MQPNLAPTIYTDGTSIFLEFPGKPGQVLRFAKEEFHKALKHIPNIQAKPGRLNWLSNGRAPTLPATKVAPTTRRKRELAKATPAVRSAALSVIRKLKIGE